MSEFPLVTVDDLLVDRHTQTQTDGSDGDIWVWVNLTKLTDFFIALEEHGRAKRSKDEDRRVLDALRKEVFREGD